MADYTKTEFARLLAEEVDLPHTKCKEVVDAAITLVEELTANSGDTLLFRGFGKFERVGHPKRSGVCNGVRWTKPAGSKLKFRRPASAV